MSIELLRARVAQAKTLCEELEYDYEMSLQNFTIATSHTFQAFASTKLARHFYDSLKLRLELREKAMACDPYPDDSKLVTFK